MNTPVSFRTASHLKKLGFNEPCQLGWYLPHPTIAERAGVEPNYWQLIPSHPLLNQWLAPTIAETVMWLYDKHGVWLFSDFSPKDGSWCFNIQKLKEVKPMVMRDGFKSPTEAYEAAISYVLEYILEVK